MSSVAFVLWAGRRKLGTPLLLDCSGAGTPMAATARPSRALLVAPAGAPFTCPRLPSCQQRQVPPEQCLLQ